MMIYTPLTSAHDLKVAFDALQAQLTRGLPRYRCRVGYPGGNQDRYVHWSRRDRIWMHLSKVSEQWGYWCCYGLDDPTARRNLTITLEINAPQSGIDRRFAGAFLKDGRGHTYLAHSGKVGGGRKGIGKTAFQESYLGGDWVDVEWPDGKQGEMILVGRLGDRSLLGEIARFVREVDTFKRRVVGPHPASGKGALEPRFSPEFEGLRTPYTHQGRISSVCTHGVIVLALKDALVARGQRVANNQLIDLYTFNKSGRLTNIFEIKTGTARSDIYAGLGQLVLHGAALPKISSRILVVPKGLRKEFRTVFDKLGIMVIEYSHRGRRVTFSKIPRME